MESECWEFKTLLEEYNIVNEHDIYDLDHSPTLDQVHNVLHTVLKRIRKGDEAESRETYAVLFLIAGRAVIKDGATMYVLNEYDEKNQFYRLLEIEELLKQMSIQLTNTFVLALFSCNRQFFVKACMSRCSNRVSCQT